ncbi:hypothetical protein OXX80_013882, partial [Metschnikowia pulcherrima]
AEASDDADVTAEEPVAEASDEAVASDVTEDESVTTVSDTEEAEDDTTSDSLVEPDKEAIDADDEVVSELDDLLSVE